MGPGAWSLIFGGLAGLFLLLLWPVRVEVSYRHLETEGDILHIAFSVPLKRYSWSWQDLFRFPWDMLMETQASKGPKAEGVLSDRSHAGQAGNTWRLLRKGLWLRRNLAFLWGRFLGRTQCHGFRCVIEVGTGNPATTGVLTGLLWNLLGLFYQNLYRQTRAAFKPELQIIPHFSTPRWQAEFHCRLTFSAGQIILAGLKSLILLWKAARRFRQVAP
ncbi:DUF2953 domain-containing protein [Moorellaceae bacterium AZ2]